MREWKMRHGQKCKGGKCRSNLAVDGQLNLECKERESVKLLHGKMFELF